MQPSDITLLTAYSHDYTVGKLCASVNRCYAESKGYGFLCEEFDCDVVSALITPKLHFTWYKVYLLLAVMKELVSERVEEGRCGYLMWIDADALVVDNTQHLESLIYEANYHDLIIAEDMHVGNLLNAGIFLLKVNDWSVHFLQDVYGHTKYNTVPFYEQSAMIHVLKRYKERVLCRPPQPFHTYITGCMDVKFGRHIAIFPTCRLNSNEGVDKADVEHYSTLNGTPINSNTAIEMTHESNNDSSNLLSPTSLSSSPKIFIFHAAGMKNKLGHLKAAIHKYHVQYDKSSVDIHTMVFAPIRNTLGHYSQEVLDLHRKYPRKIRGGLKEDRGGAVVT
ncbi:hypothetical protein EON65_51580, partial [archaeon]